MDLLCNQEVTEVGWMCCACPGEESQKSATGCKISVPAILSLSSAVSVCFAQDRQELLVVLRAQLGGCDRDPGWV